MAFLDLNLQLFCIGAYFVVSFPHFDYYLLELMLLVVHFLGYGAAFLGDIYDFADIIVPG